MMLEGGPGPGDPPHLHSLLLLRNRFFGSDGRTSLCCVDHVMHRCHHGLGHVSREACHLLGV